MNHKVAIVIVNWNGKKFLEGCLNAVYNQSYRNFVVYFVDNGSTDGSVELVRSQFPEAIVIALDKNYGFARGNNLAFEQALGDPAVAYLVCLNNDTIVDKDWLKGLVGAVDLGKNIQMVSSMSLFPDGKIQALGLKFEKNLIGDSIGGLSVACGDDPSQHDKIEEIFAPNGASCLFTVDLIKKVGMYDEDFFAYAEDLDLGMRARKVGYICVFTPYSRLTHFHSQTGGAASPFKAYLTKRNCYFTVIKNYPFFDLISYPFLEIGWNLRSVFNKNSEKSISKLKSTIGLWGMIKIMLKVYASVLLYSPRMFYRRFKKQKYLTTHKKNDDIFRESQENYYDKIASTFEKDQKRDNRNHLNKIKAISSFLEIKNGDKVLEIGVGTGIHANYLIQLNNHVNFSFVGVDLSEKMIDEARKRLICWKESISFTVADGEKLCFKDETFDKIYISGTLHHFGNPEKGVQELIRVLKSGGKFCIMEPNYFFPTNFFASQFLKVERNIRLIKKSNFNKWFNRLDCNYKILNFAYTPPRPKFLIPLFNKIDQVLFKIPFLSKISIMIFVFGIKEVKIF